MNIQSNSGNSKLVMPNFSQAATVKKTSATPSHSHPCCEIVYIDQGSCRIELEKEIFELQQGDLLVLAANTQHNQINHGLCRNSFVTFWVSEQFFPQTTRLIPMKEEVWVPQMLHLICIMSMNRAYQLCDGILLSLLKQIKIIEEQQSNRHDLPHALNIALEKIEQNYSNGDLIHKLPRACGVSASYLRLLFQKQFHCSPQVFLQNYRMSEARKRLRQFQLEVSEIAQQCGYPNANYFSRIFRCVHHCSPTEFRNIEQLRLDNFIRH